MATDTSLLIEQRLPDNMTGDIDPADVRAVAHALDNQVPNQRRGGPFLVSYLTHAAAVAAGQPTAASLDQLDADRLCLGATARVAQHPDQAGQWLVLVFDAGATVGIGTDGAGPVSSGLPVALDGNFQGTVPGKWVKLGSPEAAAVNVPAYAGNVTYAVGYLVRYGLPNGREWFYYALQAGQLPAPAPGQTSASWRIIPPPVAETLLYQYITLDEAQGIEGTSVVPGRHHGVVGKWNASADDQLVFLDGLENYFRRRGTVLHADGTQQEVDINVLAGTYAAAGGGVPDTYLELSTVNGLRVRELPVPAPFTILDELLDVNATSIRYQLDTQTRTGVRQYGTPNLTQAEVNALLDALTDADRAAGVKLYVRTGATSAVDDALIALLVRCRLNLVLARASRVDFPQPPASAGLLLNPYFIQAFTGDEFTGWQVYIGWTWDSGHSLAVCDNGQYLYQSVPFVSGARYRVLVTVVDHPDGRPASGSVYFKTTNTVSTPVRLGSGAGTYSYEFNASASAADRVHLIGSGTPEIGGVPFIGAISHFDIVRV